MDTDASVNRVAFEVREGEQLRTVIGEGPTRSLHSIELAWEALADEETIRPGDVRQVYSEWQPSAEDTAFLEGTFAGVPVSYSFARPEAGDEQAWALALAAAEATMTRSMKRKWWQFWK